jgi:predicted esterase
MIRIPIMTKSTGREEMMSTVTSRRIRRAGSSCLLAVALLLVGCGGSQEDANLQPFEPEVPVHYAVRLPTGYDANESYPLVIVLHGHNKTEGQATGLWDEGFFYMPDFILVSVRGPFNSTRGFTWYKPRGEGVDASTRRNASALTCEQLILQVIAEVEQDYSVDPDSRILLGFSRGSSIAFFAGLRNPDVFSGIASISGVVDWAWAVEPTSENAAHLDVFIGIGRREGSAMMKSARRMTGKLRKAEANAKLDIHEEGHVIKSAQIRTMQNFFDIALERAPEDDYVYNRDGTRKMEYPPGYGPDDYFEDEGDEDDGSDEY